MEEISFQCSPEEARNSEFISSKLKQEFIGEKNQKIYFLLKKRSRFSKKSDKNKSKLPSFIRGIQ